MHNPDILFLDEPTTGLDPRSRIELWQVIDDLVAEGTTLLLTTQYLEEADRLADRIAVVDHGRVIEEGTAAELKGRLGGALVEVSLADADEAARARDVLAEAGQGEVTVHQDAVHVPSAGGSGTLTEVVRRLDAAGIEARGLQVREPSLDDVFLALTGRSAEAGPAPADDGAEHDQESPR